MTVSPPVVAKQRNTQKNKFSYSKAAPKVAAQKFKQSTRRARRLFPTWLAAGWIVRLQAPCSHSLSPGVSPWPSTAGGEAARGGETHLGFLKNRAACSWKLWMHINHKGRNSKSWQLWQRLKLLKGLRQSLVISPLDAV